MGMALVSEAKQLAAARELFAYVGSVVDLPFSVRLWDGSMVPLGANPDPNFFLSINDSGVLGALLRRPSYENLLLHYVRGQVAIHGDLLDFAALARAKKTKGLLRGIRKRTVLKHALPLLLSGGNAGGNAHRYDADEVGRIESRRDNKKFIQFHYDISNEFYALFLGKEMQYSCGYFTHPDNTIDQAQHDKLEMICRKLRLQEGESFLDIGCGWGGLVCHAAQHYGVKAHGVTLAQNQLEFTQEKIARLGLEDRVTVELRDYSTLEGTYDKIASIGMFEHVGIANMPIYFKKLHSLLRDGGILLNHGITRRAKRNKKAARRIRPERQLLLKYIFPGSELDHVGHSVDTMERCGFEVHDVEAWRPHYAMTTEHWYRELMRHEEEAVAAVGEEKFRMWALYLAGVSIGFRDGSMHICQVVASKRGAKGFSELPLTRADLYR
jgi:cyclopropane-fatty-acyl-phospholipid synthase